MPAEPPVPAPRAPVAPAARALVADVLVVGAGPAGTAAAVVLAGAGRTVVVADKAVFPRDKCCGDGLTTLALRELETLGLAPRTVPSWQPVDRAWLRAPNGREVELPLPTDGTFAVTAPRRELDAALVQLAREAGADVRDGHALTALSQHHDRVQAEVTGIGSVVARYAIAADGMWSPARRMIGADRPGYLGEWHAVRQYASRVTGTAAHRLHVWFEPDLLPGYAWSFPLPGGRANVGFGVLRDGQRNGRALNDLWAGLLLRPHIAAALGPEVELEERMLAWPIPAGIDRAVLGRGRTLLVGDAAMATDTMTGEGIGQALLTGRLAAEAVLAAGALRPAAAIADYERSVRRHLLADHRMSAALGRVLVSGRATDAAIRLAGLNNWTRRNFARWMFEDEPRAVALTPRRWHRSMFHRPGPYRASEQPQSH